MVNVTAMTLEEIVRSLNVIVGGIGFIMALYVQNSLRVMQNKIMSDVDNTYISRKEIELIERNIQQNYEFTYKTLARLETGMQHINDKIDRIERSGRNN